MNPTNESIGRAFREHVGSEAELQRLYPTLCEKARELDRQAPGDAVRQAIADRPVYLMGREHIEDENKPLCEIEYATIIQGGVMFQMKDKDADIPVPQPPAQEQGDDGAPEHWGDVMRELEATVPDDLRPLVFRLAFACDQRLSFFHVRMRELEANLARAAGSEDARDSELLNAVETNRISLVPEYEGGWDAEVYFDEGRCVHMGGGQSARAAIDSAVAAIASQAEGGSHG